MKLSLNKKQALWGYIFLALPLMYFTGVFVVPMFQAFRFSLLEYNTLSLQQTYIGLENYRDLAADSEFQKALENTIKYAIARAPVVLLLSFITALLFQNIRRFSNVLRTILLFPFMTSLVAMAWLWTYMYSRSGPINIFLNNLGVEKSQLLLYPQTALYAIVVVTIWGSLGYYTLLFKVGLDAIPRHLYDAAKVDGASAWQLFRHITLPLLNPTLVLLSVIAVTASLKNFAVVRIMSGGSGDPLDSTLTLPLLIYLRAFTDLEMGNSAAITVAFFALILVVTYIQLRLMTREIEY